MANQVKENTPLAGWRDGHAKRAILVFVRRVAAEVPVEERVAVFDNDGTLWGEKPMPIRLDFILGRPAEMAAADPAVPSLRARPSGGAA